MLNSLRSRNLALMTGVLLMAQLLTTILVISLAIMPQVDRVASVIAGNVRMVGVTMDTLTPDQRQQYIDRANQSGAFRVVPSGNVIPGADGTPTLLEQSILARLAELLGQRDTMVWRGGGGAPLWVRMQVGQVGTYWITVTPTPGWSPIRALVASVALALALSLLTGLVLQRRVNRPLTELRDAVDAMPDARPFGLLATQSPAEIAAVADSFVRMADRLTKQEAERTLMLTGISHDLKTPLAKLRLALALAGSTPPEFEALIERQLDQLESMLNQFLDFGRGLDSELPVPKLLLPAIMSVAADQALEDSVNVAPDMADVVVRLRPLGFGRTLTNLIRNAQVHGEPPYTISVSKSGDRAVITVDDCGPGVPAALISKLDQPFVRVGDHRPSDGGVGLGLAIVRRFADVHDASLQFSNLDGGGFRVILSLPIDLETRPGSV